LAMPGVPADQVVAQSPSPNASSVSAPKISLLAVVPAPPEAFVMPTFVGQTLGSVTATLKDAGFRVGNVSLAPAVESSVPSPQTVGPPQPSPASIVVSQSPAPGAKVVVGESVSFEVR
jgi:beta-lactam-binding protein with PASTA domain